MSAQFQPQPVSMTRIPVATLGKLHDRIAALEKDAARLDWLDAQRDLFFDCYMQDGKITHILRRQWGAALGHGPTPRAAIDAAIATTTGSAA